MNNIDILSKEFHDLANNKDKLLSIHTQLHSAGYASCAASVDAISILSPEACQVLNDTVIPNLFRGNFDTGVYPDEWHWREGISKPEAVREMCNAWKSSRFVAAIVLNEHLGRFIADIMGWTSVRIAQDDIVCKTPHPNSSHDADRENNSRIDTVGFHQDSAYISKQFTPYENNSVTLWIALDDADQENGCLEYIPTSHKWRPILHLIPSGEDDSDHMHSVSSFHDSDETSYRSSMLNGHEVFKRYCERNNTTQPPLKIQNAAVKAGTAVIHHQDVWHGSGPNKSSTRYRRSLVVHYLKGDIRFLDDSDGSALPPFRSTTYIYGRYKKYQSNELDETFFPIVYSQHELSDQRRTEWLDKYIGNKT